MTLNGAYNVYVKKGGTYTEKGVIATTKEGLNVTNQVVKTGTMDTNTLGTYVITYTYDNVSITRNVIVVTSEMITERIWHALTINPNGGTYNGSVSNKIYSLKEGSNQTIANPTRTNYNFTGWSRTCTSCLSGGIYTMGTIDDTLTANWVLSAYTLTVNANGGTWSGTTPQTIVKGSTVTINNPTKSGTIFLGWMVNGTESSMSGTTFTIGTANTTITAIWLAYTYTGSSTIIDDGSGNWRIKFLTSGTFTPSTNMVIEAFLVGGGGGGGTGYVNGNNYAGSGGGGGYANTRGVVSLIANTSYAITIGSGGTGGTNGGTGSTGGTTSAFNYTAAGGTGGNCGGAGGSGGGAAYFQLGGVNGVTNGGQGRTNSTNLGGTGQGTNTYEFDDASLTLYSGGGGSGAFGSYAGGTGGAGGGANGAGGGKGQNGYSAAANTGGGGGGATSYNTTGGNGGSGVVVIALP